MCSSDPAKKTKIFNGIIAGMGVRNRAGQYYRPGANAAPPSPNANARRGSTMSPAPNMSPQLGLGSANTTTVLGG
ncbi:hypothetical protein ACVWZA_002460 [Sphingomonas sp. UYAg733]